MNVAKGICLLLLLASGCSPTSVRDVEDVKRCWEYVRQDDDIVQINRVKMVYLRGKTVVIPSSKCEGVRLQAVEISPSSLDVLRGIEYRDVAEPLAIEATARFVMIKRASNHVIEIRLISLTDMVKLDHDNSMKTMDSVRAS